MSKLILASTSKYRRELLARLNLDFECVSPGVDEEKYKADALAPLELSSKLARLKAQAVADLYPDSVVVGSDQVAALNDLILDKPGSKKNALNQLLQLSGRKHHLFTAVSIIHPDGIFDFVDTTNLYMKNLTEKQILRYLQQDEPYDCAGSYKIETLGISLFDKIETQDFTAIIGLPLLTLSKYLIKIGYELP